MGKLKYLILAVTTLFLLTTCKKNDQDSSREVEYIVFGHFYGECVGKDCIDIFKMDCCHIYEDTNDFYPNMIDPYKASYIELDSRERDSVSFLIYRIPHVLFFETARFIGQPDAADQGGLYVEIKCVGKPVQYWFIDQNKANIPSYLHTFVDDINKAVKLLM